MSDLDTIQSNAQAAFAAAATPADLENAKAQFLGKQGQLTELMKGMAALSVKRKRRAELRSTWPSKLWKPR